MPHRSKCEELQKKKTDNTPKVEQSAHQPVSSQVQSDEKTNQSVVGKQKCSVSPPKQAEPKQKKAKKAPKKVIESEQEESKEGVPDPQDDWSDKELLIQPQDLAMAVHELRKENSQLKAENQ